jgi:hypothetical protein
MGRMYTGDGVQIFKFKDTGLADLIEEAADYIKKRRAAGLPELEHGDVRFNALDGMFVFTFPLENVAV